LARVLSTGLYSGCEILDGADIIRREQTPEQFLEVQPLERRTLQAAVAKVEPVYEDVGSHAGWHEKRKKKAEAGPLAGLAPSPRRGRGGNSIKMVPRPVWMIKSVLRSIDCESSNATGGYPKIQAPGSVSVFLGER
jgi:hypothetical protein